nr:MAG TPA: head to tail adaptor [Caudoviricetes sp.]DAN79337.1 MAG TPA: head to tail adaptor [Caudoviricetes sp.]DAO39452.1 MAG TPA: head to tail adaptor [Caudoviricetes sp.]
MEYVENIKDDVIKTLKSVGYEVVDTDLFLLEQSIEKVKSYIKNKTNQNKVPEGLKYIWVDRSTGEFLYFKKSLNQLELKGLDFDRVAKEISEGDTKVVFEDTKSVGDKFEVFTTYLMTRGEDELLRYRRIVW